MKKTIISLVMLITFSVSFSQKVAYTSEGKKIKYQIEKNELLLTPSTVASKGLSAGMATSLPTIVDAGLKQIGKIIENNLKKYTAEYSKTTSYLEAKSGFQPVVEFKRSIEGKQALSLTLKPLDIAGVDGIVYFISDIKLDKSSAIFKKGDKLDYTVEIIPTILLKNGEQKKVDVKPIVVQSVDFTENQAFSTANNEYRTEMIPIPSEAIITDIAIKITETNPRKIKLEKIQAIFNDHKDDAKTIINNFLPKAD